MISRLSPARFCLVLLVLGLLVSGAFNGLNRSWLYVNSDARAYFLTAKNLAHGLGYTEGERNHWRDSIYRVCPIYIASLAGVFRLLGPEETWRGQNRLDQVQVQAILLFETILYALGAILAYLIARQVWDETSACWTGLICLLVPDFITYAGMVMAESLANLLTLGAALAAFAYLRRRRPLWPVLAAFGLLGLGVLTRPNLLAPALCLIGFLAWRRDWPAALAGLLVLVLVLTPFSLRNLDKYGRAWYATSTLNFNLLVGNIEGSMGEFIFDQDEMSRRLKLDYREAQPVELDEAARRELWRLVREKPGHVLGINLLKFVRYWSVFRTSANQWMNNNPWIRRAQLLVSIFTNSWLFILGPAGLLLAAGPPLPRRAMLVYIGLIFVTAVPMYLNHRYRFAFFPFLVMGAVVLSRRLWNEWRPRLRALGWRGLWQSLDTTQRGRVWGLAGWAAFVWGGSLVDGLYRFERFLNYVYGQNIYF